MFPLSKRLTQSSEAGSKTRHRRSLSMRSPLCKARSFHTIPLQRLIYMQSFYNRQATVVNLDFYY